MSEVRQELALWQAYCEKKMALEGAQDEIKKLRAALKECADDLEEEINGKYRGSQNIYIHEMHRFDRDMAPVTNARKLLQGEKE
jgi:hypothetical protein